MMLVRYVKVMLATFLLLSLAACASPPRYKVKKLTNAEVREDYIGLLTKTGAQVAVQGETVKVMVPSDILFKERSANLRHCAFPMLRRIGVFLPLYNPENIQVSAYTDTSEPEKFQKLLSSRQAQVVINSLWPRGIRASMVYAEGYGSSYPIASNDTSSGREINRRVEFVFRYYPIYRTFD